MTAQLADPREVRKIYANQTTNNQTTTSILVKENGIYHVTIFAISRGIGILNSNIEYSGQLTVYSITQETTTITMSTTGIILLGCS